MKEEWLDGILEEFIEVNPKVRLEKGRTYPFVSMDVVQPFYKPVTPVEEREFKSGGSKFENGDTLFARITPCLENGKTAQVKNINGNIGFGSTEFFILRGKEGITDNEFVYYLSTSETFRKNAEKLMTGTSGRQRVDKQQFLKQQIKLPPLEIQQKIASILKVIDDKIELNNQMNKTLEEMAMTLYNHWFVDFGPFQDNEFVESELGMIPKGWEIHSIYDLADYVNGKAFKTKDLYEVGKLPVIKIAELKSGLSNNTKFYNGEYRQKHEINNGDVLFAWSASLGVYLWGKGKALLNQHIFNVKPKDSSIIRKSFIYFMLRRLIDKFVNIAASRATTMGHITKSHLINEKIALPPEKELEEIQDRLDYYYQLMLLNTVGNESLIQTRDYLLPKLLSGEIDVTKAKEKVKETIL